jgi:hypothetical protein
MWLLTHKDLGGLPEHALARIAAGAAGAGAALFRA